MFEGYLQIAIFVVVLVALIKPIGIYLARVFNNERTFLTPVLGGIERGTYRVLRVNPEGEGQDWKAYARSLIVFSLLFWILLYLILRTQSIGPFNPEGFHAAPWDLTFNTTSSFITNTNWQYYGGETTFSYFAQMAGLAVQNFVSAAVGIAVVAALIRGIVARSGKTIGNFWQDIVRIILYVLLPMSIIGALFLVSQGVIQNLSHATMIHTLSVAPQILAQGPVASQEAIKELGTNGGGFNVNSAYPFENPSGLTNFFEMLLILIIPAGLTYTYGRMVGSQRQGWAIFSAMFVLFIIGVVVVYMAEQHGSPAQHAAGLNTHAIHGSTGGNMEGKDQRYGVANTSLWAAITTVTSCGAVNGAFESLTGIGGAVPFSNLGFSEVVFGGVGTGLYSMLLYVILAVFIGGLMVGRTPEYLGKKIGAREIKLVSLGVLFTPLAVLLSAGAASATELGKRSLYAGINPTGFSENLYAYLSQANNNGSAWAGYTGFIQPHAPGNAGSYGITFADLLGGFVMVTARYAPILFVLAVAGALAGKKVSPAGLGTMRTDNPTFVFLLIGIVILVGALTFFPAILLGPIANGLTGRLF